MNEKYTLKIYRIIFLILGVKVDSDTLVYEKYYFFLLCANIMVTCGPEIAAIFIINGFLNRMEALSDALTTITVMLQPMWMRFVTRERIIAFYTSLLRNDDIFDDNFCDHFERTAKPKLKVITYYNLSAAIVAYLTPIFLWFVTEESVRRRNSSQLFLLTAVYPWSTACTAPFILTVLLQMVALHGSFIYLCGLLLHGYCYLLFSLMHSRLVSQIDEKLNAKDAVIERMPDETRLHMLSALQQVITYHKFTVKMMRDFSFISKPFMYTAVFYFFMAGTVYFMKTFDQESGNRLGSLDFSGFVAVVWISFPLVCSVSVGQLYDEFNDRIVTEISHTSWFNKSVKYRKTLTIFLAMLQKPETIKLFGFCTINWKYFTSVCKFTYSVLQLLRGVQRKRNY